MIKVQVPVTPMTPIIIKAAANSLARVIHAVRWVEELGKQALLKSPVAQQRMQSQHCDSRHNASAAQLSHGLTTGVAL